MDKTQFKNIDEYIAACPRDAQVRLRELRRVIREAAPGAEEVISYSMPAFKLHGVLVYFAAFKSHIGFYPTGSGIEAFASELGHRVTGKGTVRLPFDEPLPLPLIRKIVAFRVREQQAKSAKKTRAR